MTVNGTSTYPSDGIQLFEFISILFMCVVGVIGNTLVILVVYRQSKMRTVTNYFIVNLAVADLFVLLINVPLDLGVKLTGPWQYGAAMCKLIPPLQTMATTVSVWSLVAISIGRYIAIVYPFRPQLQTRHAKWIIFVVWTIGLIVVIPYMLALELDDGQCGENFEAAGMTAAGFTVAVFVSQYIVPMSIILACYIRIGRELSRSGLGHENSKLIKEQQKETKKVVKILRLVVSAFAILVLPIHLLYIWIDFFDGSSSPNCRLLRVISVVMLYGNSASNPILYNICNEQFRDGFRQYFKPCRKLCPGLKCIEEGDYSNTTKDTDFPSLVYNPNIRLSDINQNDFKKAPFVHTNKTVVYGSFDGGVTQESDCSLTPV